MEKTTPGSAGILGSLRSLGDHLLASVQDRLELFSIDLHEEKFRLIQTFIWISVGVFTGMMAVMFASLTMVYLFWESARLAVLGGLAGFYLVALAIVVVAFRRFIARQPKPFAATLQEINTDRACIRNPS
jgi:uncharacterized membrane protein YqjE